MFPESAAALARRSLIRRVLPMNLNHCRAGGRHSRAAVLKCAPAVARQQNVLARADPAITVCNHTRSHGHGQERSSSISANLTTGRINATWLGSSATARSRSSDPFCDDLRRAGRVERRRRFCARTVVGCCHRPGRMKAVFPMCRDSATPLHKVCRWGPFSRRCALLPVRESWSTCRIKDPE